MSGTTDDPKDPRLPHPSGPDQEQTPQQDVYLVLSVEERAKGFVRPVRREYKHVGPAGPQHPLRDLTDAERARYDGVGYVKFEVYPESMAPRTGMFWTQDRMDAVAKGGCGSVTTMGIALAETYAREPRFYGSTYCVCCRKHLLVGAAGEFVWLDGSRVGS